MLLFSITDRGLTPNPSYNARFIGVLYVVLLVFGPFTLIYIPVTVYVLDDPIATANNIAANQGLLRLGLFSTSTLVVVEILICAQLFQLFRYLRTTVLMASISARLLMVGAQTAGMVFQGAALILAAGVYPHSALRRTPMGDNVCRPLLLFWRLDLQRHIFATTAGWPYDICCIWVRLKWVRQYTGS